MYVWAYKPTLVSVPWYYHWVYLSEYYHLSMKTWQHDVAGVDCQRVHCIGGWKNVQPGAAQCIQTFTSRAASLSGAKWREKGWISCLVLKLCALSFFDANWSRFVRLKLSLTVASRVKESRKCVSIFLEGSNCLKNSLPNILFCRTLYNSSNFIVST